MTRRNASKAKAKPDWRAEAGRKGGQIGGRARTAKKLAAAHAASKIAASKSLTPAQRRARSANMKRLNQRRRGAK